MAESWDRVVDVVIVGTGGAALTAATLAHDGGAEVLIVEKEPMLGGTTAVSGGGVWLPGNHVMKAAGVEDSKEDALAYIRRVCGGSEPDPELLEVYVDTAPEVLRYLEDNTPLSTHIQPLPDYYWPWGFPGTKMQPGRTVEADPYPVGDELPEWKDRIVKRGTLMSLGAATTLAEDLLPQGPELEAELKRREEQDIRPKGAALIARLFKGLLERGVETWLRVAGQGGRHRRRRRRDRHRGRARRRPHPHRRPQGRRAGLRRLRVEPGARARPTSATRSSRSARAATPATA